MTERDVSFEAWPGEVVDQIRDAVGKLLIAIIENTAEGSRERTKAMVEAMAAHDRIRDAMRVRPRLN